MTIAFQMAVQLIFKAIALYVGCCLSRRKMTAANLQRSPHSIMIDSDFKDLDDPIARDERRDSRSP